MWRSPAYSHVTHQGVVRDVRVDAAGDPRTPARPTPRCTTRPRPTPGRTSSTSRSRTCGETGRPRICLYGARTRSIDLADVVVRRPAVIPATVGHQRPRRAPPALWRLRPDQLGDRAGREGGRRDRSRDVAGDRPRRPDHPGRPAGRTRRDRARGRRADLRARGPDHRRCPRSPRDARLRPDAPGARALDDVPPPHDRRQPDRLEPTGARDPRPCPRSGRPISERVHDPRRPPPRGAADLAPDPRHTAARRVASPAWPAVG